eukprot:866036-Amphidinium_carterae.1
MAVHMPIQRKIQENRNDALHRKDAPLGLAHTPPRGRYDRETVKLVEGPPSGLRAEGGAHDKNRKRTSFMVFDMVAELAIAKRVVGLASLLASIVVTRA